MSKEGLKQFNTESEENIEKNGKSWAGFETAEERLKRQFQEKEQQEIAKIPEQPKKDLENNSIPSDSLLLEEKTKEIARRIYEQRMSGKGRKPKETIDKILEAHGIKPWTSEAEEFMKKWDWEQAEKLAKSHSQEKIQEEEEIDSSEIISETPSEKEEIKKSEKIDKSQKEILQDDLWLKRFSYVEKDIASRSVDKIRGERKSRIFGIFSKKRESLKLQESKSIYEEALVKYGHYLYEHREKLGLSEADIFQEIIIKEQDGLAKEHIANREPLKQTWFRKLMADYVSMPLWKRVAISSAIATGLFAAGGALGLGGVAAAAFIAPAKFATTRIVRGILGAKMAALTGGFVKIYKTRKAEEYRKKEMAVIKDLFGIQIGKIDSEAEFRQLLAGISDGYQKTIKNVNKKHKNASRWAAAAAIGAGGLTAGILTMTELDGPLCDLINDKLGFGGHKILSPRVSAESFSTGRVPPPESFSWKEAMSPGGPKVPPAEKLFEEMPRLEDAPADLADVSPEKIEKVVEAAVPVENADHLLDLATVQQGKGIWHAIYKQLDYKLRHNPSKFGLTPEDLQDADRVKNVLNNQTGKLLVEQGYVKADGTEIRIAKPGVKVFLDTDNNIRIEDGGNPTYEWSREVGKTAEAVEAAEKLETPEISPVEIPKTAENVQVEDFQTEQAVQAVQPETLPLETEIPAASEPEISPFPEKVIENTDYGVKGIFKYMANGDIGDVSVSSPIESQWKQVSKLFNKDWEDIVKNKFTPLYPEQIESLKNKAKMLFQYNQLLKTLESIGKNDSLEADFLRVKIYKLVEKTEEMYGDVFK
ncbi:MAG: hypothetical protein AAB405_02495 [Patescibacteria group bacterium]